MAKELDRIPPILNHRASDHFRNLYNAVISSVPSSLLMIDRGLRVVTANRNFLEKARRSEANTLGQHLNRVFPPALLEQTQLDRKIRQVFATQQPGGGDKITYRAPGMPTRTYYYRLVPVPDQDELAYVILFMDDITEQERLTEEVRRIERHLASVVESANDLVVSTDIMGRILTWNRAAESISGRPAHEIIGQPLSILSPDEQQPLMAEMLVRLVQGQPTPNRELSLITRDGRLVPIAWACSPMRDYQEQVIGGVAVGRDLTEQRRLENQVFQAAKMASLGIMAGGIAHEVRNPLAIIAAAAQLAEEVDDPALRSECLARIRTGVGRASQIIENLLKFARPTTGQLERLDLVAVVHEAVELLANQLVVQRVALDLALPSTLPPVQGNRALLQQVCANLILNACQAMPRGGQLRVAAGVNAEGQVTLSFADTGNGIAPEDLGRIFDPFFTTRPVGQGVGLGLAISFSIVQQHEGTIAGESVPGQGSTFTITLPLAPS